MDDELQKLAVYLPFIASILCFFLSKRLYFYFRRHLRKWDLNPVRRRLLYKIVTRRFDGSSNLSLFLLIVILVLAALNAFALFFKNATKGGISQRSASLSQLNLMILCFGSSLSFLNEKFFGFNLRTLAPLHYWIGRMYLVHLSLHGFIQLSLQHWTLPSIPALLVSVKYTQKDILLLTC